MMKAAQFRGFAARLPERRDVAGSDLGSKLAQDRDSAQRLRRVDVSCTSALTLEMRGGRKLAKPACGRPPRLKG